jgi:hypothetical protein
MIRSQPRFHMMRWAQLIAVLMVGSGIVPFWVTQRSSRIPNSILWRSGGVALLLVLSAILPQIGFVKSQLRAMGGVEVEEGKGWTHNPQAVRQMIWYYCIMDMILLIYLVHITGGITGSMFAGVYLTIPAVGLLLILTAEDISRTAWLIFLAILGIGLSFCMSHFDSPEGYSNLPMRFLTHVEYDASAAKHPFDIAMGLVGVESALLLMAQVILMKLQFEQERRQNRLSG